MKGDKNVKNGEVWDSYGPFMVIGNSIIQQHIRIPILLAFDSNYVSNFHRF